MASLLWAYCFKLINMHVLSPFICFSIYFEVASLEPALLFCVKTLGWHFSARCVSGFYLGWKWDRMLHKSVNSTSGDIWCPAEWISWPPHPHCWEMFFLLALKLTVYIANFRASNISAFVKHLPQGSTAPHCASTKTTTTWVTLSLSPNVSSTWKSYFQHGRRNQLWLRYQILSAIRESDSAVVFYFWLCDSGAAHCSDDTVSHNWELLWGGGVKAFI